MALNLKNLSVLIIDDYAEMRAVLKAILQRLGITVIYTAKDGNEGLERLIKSNPDVVFCDWEMPECNGVEFIREARTNMAVPNRMVPIIMVSGYNAVTRVVKSRDAGTTEYLIKPFTAHDVARKLEVVINKPRDFVVSGEFTGPDRRRRKFGNYKGPERRDESRRKD